ncbi:hypothetical protein Tco_0588091, partial [Tanacetum coccineum]
MKTEEQEELSIEEKSNFFVELLEKRKKHFATLRAQEKRSKPPTKAQKRNTMSTYLKNMAGYKHNQLNRKKFVKSSWTRTEGSSKRARDELESDNSKKQNLYEHVEAEEKDDQEEAEMKRHIEIVKDDEVAIDAIPLSTKPPVIVEYKIYKDGRMGYFKLIRVDGSSKRPEEDYERVLWGDLKVMFEPDIKSEVWRNLKGYKVTVWKLFDNKAKKSVRLIMEKLVIRENKQRVLAKTVNGEVQLQALMDGKKIIITESIVRRDLQLEDVEGVDCLPNATIFEQRTLMGRSKRKDTEVPQPSGPTTNVADEAVNKEMDDSLVRVATTASSLEAEQDSGYINKTQSKETPNEPSSPGTSSGVESSDEEGLGEDDASKQGRITNIDANEYIYLVNVQTGEDMFGVNDLDGDEVIVESVDVVNTAEETRSVVEEVTAITIPVSAATTTTTTTTITDVEMTLAQALAELKSLKPKADKVVIQELDQGTTTPTLTTTTAATSITAISTRPGAKGLVIHEQEQAPTVTFLIF